MTNPSRTNKVWFLEPSIGLGQNIGLDLSNQISADLTDEWNKRVDLIASYHTEINVGRIISDNNYITLGLEYQHSEFQFFETLITSSNEIVFNPNAYVTTSDTFIGDFVEVDVSFNTQISKPIRVTNINIPLDYNYAVFQSKYWTFGVSTGLIINVSRQYQGLSINTELEWEDHRGRSSFDFSLGYQLGLRAAYSISDNGSIIINPNFRYQPRSVLAVEPFTPSSLLLLVNLGYRIKF